MRELSGNNRAAFTQAVGYNVRVILGFFVSHSVLKHEVAAAARVTRQSCRFVAALCYSHHSGLVNTGYMPCLEESSVAFQSNGFYIGLWGLCVCVSQYVSWYVSSLVRGIFVCVSACSSLISCKNSNHLCLFVPPGRVLIIGLCCRWLCVRVRNCVWPACAGADSVAAGQSPEPPSSTNKLCCVTASGGLYRHDLAEPYFSTCWEYGTVEIFPQLQLLWCP